MEHIYSLLVQVGDCWEWQGYRGPHGHGAVYHDGASRPAYRVIWEHLRGEVPEGLELDHLCRNPPCCNPDHLDPVTHAENMRRGAQSYEVRSHCLAGLHELTPDNVITRLTDGRQQCRACRNDKRRTNRRRRRALGLAYQ